MNLAASCNYDVASCPSSLTSFDVPLFLLVFPEEDKCVGWPLCGCSIDLIPFHLFLEEQLPLPLLCPKARKEIKIASTHCNLRQHQHGARNSPNYLTACTGHDEMHRVLKTSSKYRNTDSRTQQEEHIRSLLGKLKTDEHARLAEVNHLSLMFEMKLTMF